MASLSTIFESIKEQQKEPINNEEIFLDINAMQKAALDVIHYC